MPFYRKHIVLIITLVPILAFVWPNKTLFDSVNNGSNISLKINYRNVNILIILEINLMLRYETNCFRLEYVSRMQIELKIRKVTGTAAWCNLIWISYMIQQ